MTKHKKAHKKLAIGEKWDTFVLIYSLFCSNYCFLIIKTKLVFFINTLDAHIFIYVKFFISKFL